jgi:tRNA(adenine34) deaminase
MMLPEDRGWMLQAIKQAVAAAELDEVPVGAIIVHKGKIIGTGYNQREQLNDPTAHAEMIAITQAASVVQTWRLSECTMYVTLEPCPMCAGAIVNSRISRLVYGAADPKAGAVDSLFRLLDDPRLNHRTPSVGGVLGVECGQLLSQFFLLKRQMGKK